MKLEDIMLSEIRQSQEDKTAWFYIYEVSKVVRLLETESRMVVARGPGDVGKQGCSMGTEFQFCKMKSSRNLFHNYVHIVNTTVLYT